jgi:lipooligosaccharide transport system ATP-binding protein
MTQQQSPLVTARDLTKRFGDLVAVDGINFAIDQGECFGFLGPNGAGKTTTLRMITCMSPLTSGELSVMGMSVTTHQREIKSRLGVVSQSNSLDPGLNVAQNLQSYARFFNLPRKTAERRIEEALAMVQLAGRAASPVDDLSGGMRRRLLIARALLHRPRMLVLDEPTTGLDPQTRRLVWEKLNTLKSEGVTVLLSTHYMDEAAYLCDRLVVVDQGKILEDGTPANLVADHAGEWVMQVDVGDHGKAGLLAQLGEHGVQFDDVGAQMIVYSRDGMLATDDPMFEGLKVVRRPSNLEDVFLQLTGRGLREE